MEQDLIEISGISKYYSKLSVLHDMSLNIPRNSISAVIGPNGSGKSTLFKCILGINNIDNGIIRFPSNTKFGFTLDDFRPYDHLSVYDNLCAFYKLSDNSRKDMSDRINEIMSMVFINSLSKKKTRYLSTGQMKKLMFALALINDPDVLVFDEPLNSLDLKERIDIISSIKYIKQEMGKTIILSSHDLPGIFELSDIFFFVKNGKINSYFSKSEITFAGLEKLYLEIYNVKHRNDNLS